MRILSRFSDILVANIHALLDRVENPEAMIGQVIREMEDGLAVARSYAACGIAVERRLARELAQQPSTIEFWRTRAGAAVKANRDDLARLALARKKEHEALAADLENQYTGALKTATEVRASLCALEAALAAARRKQHSLIARHRAAQTWQALGRAAGTRLGTGFTAGAKLQHWEERLTQLEDELTAQAEVQGLGALESNFANWETEVALDRELAALKAEDEECPE